jgi:hypothetical protein
MYVIILSRTKLANRKYAFNSFLTWVAIIIIKSERGFIMLNKTVTVTANQRFVSSASSNAPSVIVVSKGDILKVKRHGLIRKNDYIVLPNVCLPNRILLDSALKDGWIKVNN